MLALNELRLTRISPVVGLACEVMRNRVESVLALLGNGLSTDEILRELPDLEPLDVIACVQCKNRMSEDRVL